MRKAFTLAEVLITLTIIGVIAALTIPSLMKNYKNHVTVTKVQKAYSILSRAAANIKTNTGVDTLEDTGWKDLSRKELFEKFVEVAQIKDAEIYDNTNWFRVKYLYCEKRSNNSNCTDSEGYPIGGIILTQDNFVFVPNYQYNQSTGRQVLNIYVGTEYTLKDGTNARPGELTRYRQYKLGRNFFAFTLTNDFKLVPFELSNGTNPVNDCDFSLSGVSVQGFTCSKRIILDGWKIKY